MSDKILIVDDEHEIADLIEVYLNNEGYEVFKFYTAREALDCIDRTALDLAILDVMLPDINGLALCQKIREKYTYPVIMLTAKDGEMDKITGLTLGADDYVTKPFSVAVFQKKVAAILSRIEKKQVSDVFDDGYLAIDFTENTCTAGQVPVALTPKEWKLLKIFAKSGKQVLTRQILLDRLWDIDGNFVDDHTLTTTLSALRKKIENKEQTYIQTIYGMGYMWKGGEAI